jgi:hypothetical protein
MVRLEVLVMGTSLPNRIFYDIHCHAFNLSHPSMYGFLENLRHSNAGDLLKEVFTLREFTPIRNLATT